MSTEAGAVVRGGLIVTVAVMGGLDILLTQVGDEEADHCKRGEIIIIRNVTLQLEHYRPASPGGAEPEVSG